MKRKRLVLLLFLGRRRGVRLWRTDREVKYRPRRWQPFAAVADWEHELLARDPRARFFSW